MKVDLHIHSNHSFDSFSSVKKIIRKARKENLAAISITDHNTMKAYEDIPKVNDLIIVRGVELSNEVNDIVALFVSKKPEGKTFVKQLQSIKEQGGLAVLAHPTRYSRDKNSLEKIDLIETINSRTNNEKNKHAKILYKKSGKSFLGVSDAHFIKEIGNAYTKTPNFRTKKELYNILKKGKTIPVLKQNTPYHNRVLSQIIKVIKKKDVKKGLNMIKKGVKKII